MEETLNGEINALGYRRRRCSASAWPWSRITSCAAVKAALRSVHGEAKVADEVSGYYVADEIQMCHRGMIKAIPKDEWVVFR